MKSIEIGSDSLRATLGSLGARILKLSFHGQDVALSHTSTQEAADDQAYLGVTVGPICNRIADGRFSIADQLQQLPQNEGDHCLHSGPNGFHRKDWQVTDSDDRSVEYALEYDLAEVGLAGKLSVRACYSIDGETLSVVYRSQCDRDTYVNITNHVYLNLGQVGQNIVDHRFQLYGNAFVETDSSGIPTGNLRTVKTPLLYRLEDSSIFDGGVDHHFVVADDETKMRTMMHAHSIASGIGLRVRSDAPGYQFYTAQYLSTPFVPSGAFCVETQYAPNAINQANFFSPIQKAGETHTRTTLFEFSQAKF